MITGAAKMDAAILVVSATGSQINHLFRKMVAWPKLESISSFAGK
jgi:translation elongation factor EF-Tu-like GTPase